MEPNTVTISVQPNLLVPEGSVIVFSGFSAATGPVSNSGLSVSGDTSIFGTTCGWDLAAGKLTCTLLKTLPFHLKSTVSFILDNPISSITTPLTVTCSNNAFTIAATPITPNPFPMSSVTGFFSKTILQYTSGCTFCPLDILLNPSAAINAGSTICIKGLLISSTADNLMLAVDDTSVATNAAGTSGAFGSSGAWTKSTGLLKLTLAPGKSLSAGQIYNFRLLTIAQPVASQAPPKVLISTDCLNYANMEVGTGVFQGALPPKLSSVSPASGTTGVKTSDIFTLIFDKSIVMSAAGSIQFYDAAGVAVGNFFFGDPPGPRALFILRIAFLSSFPEI